MKFNPITPDFLAKIIEIVGTANVFSEAEHLEKYARDETEDLVYYPEAVVRPNTSNQISELMRLCNSYKIPVTPRGAGTGLSGGALPVKGGLVISMERFNAIIEIDERNLQATVEPGVITEFFMNAVAEKGLLYPVDPSSKGS